MRQCGVSQQRWSRWLWWGAGRRCSHRRTNALSRRKDALSYCPDRFPASERPSPQAARKRVERLIAIYRKDPDAIQNAEHEEERTSMRVLLEVIARNLTLDQCDPALVRRINAALEE
jgi:hypothetical protein